MAHRGFSRLELPETNSYYVRKSYYATRRPVHRNMTPPLRAGIGNVRTVDSTVGHLARSTTWIHYFWTTSFFSDTYKIRLTPRLVKRSYS